MVPRGQEGGGGSSECNVRGADVSTRVGSSGGRSGDELHCRPRPYVTLTPVLKGVFVRDVHQITLHQINPSIRRSTSYIYDLHHHNVNDHHV